MVIKYDIVYIMNNNQHPTFSLIIPAYNEEKYIGDCLSSVIKNTSGIFLEIIVINNASTDRTAEIAQSFPGVTVVHEPRKGLTFARQCGYESAHGDILVYIDADTRVPETWANILVSEFSNNKNTACLSGPYVFYDFPKWRQILTRATCTVGYALFGYFALGGNFSIRRSILEKMNGFDTTISFYGEDTNVARRAHEFGKVLFNPDFFIYTSARRFKGQGFITTSRIYLVNFLSEIFLKRPTTTEYRDIR